MTDAGSTPTREGAKANPPVVELRETDMTSYLPAMPNTALRSGRRGRTFESCRPDFADLAPSVGEPLILRGLSNEAYHSRPEHSKSPLWAFRRHGPVWYYEQYIARSHAPFASDSLARGTLVHLVFELGWPEFQRRVVRVPAEYCTATGTLSAGKEAKAWLADQPSDAILLTPADEAVINGIWKQANDNAAVREVIDSVEESELSVCWLREDGHALRCRFDAITSDGRLIDWKTTREARPLESWWKTALEHGYHYQQSLYEQGALEAGISDQPMTFVVLSTTPPYQVQAVTLPHQLVARCDQWITDDLEEIALRTEMGNFLPEGYGKTHEIVFPEWALREGR